MPQIKGVVFDLDGTLIDTLGTYTRAFNQGIAKFDLIFAVLESKNSIITTLTYSTALFKKSTAEKMVTRYIEILEQVVEDREIKLKDLAISHDLLVARKDTPEINFGF